MEVKQLSDKFIPQKGDLRVLWFAGLNSKRISARGYRIVNLVATSSELACDVHQLNLSAHSIFLLGTVRVYERQAYYLYKELHKLVYRFNETMKVLHPITIQTSSTTATGGRSSITLPTASDLVLTAFNELSNNCGPNDSHNFLPELEFFSVCMDHPDNNQENSHTVSNMLDITLPSSNDTGSSLAYSINEPHQSDCNFADTTPTGDQPIILNDANCNYDNDDIPAPSSPVGSFLTPEIQPNSSSRPSISISKFISPLTDNRSEEIELLPYEPALNKKPSKRRLVFDKKTKITDKKLARNKKSWQDTLRKSDSGRVNSIDLLVTPCDPTAYSNSDILHLWQRNASSFDDVPVTQCNYEDESIEVMRGGRSLMMTGSYNSSAATANTDFSLNASNSLNQGSNEFSRFHGRHHTMAGLQIGGLSPIIDMEFDDDDEPPFKDELESRTPNSSPLINYDDSKLHNFYKSRMLSKMGDKDEMFFSDIVSRNSTRFNASLAMMHVLELINQGVVSPVQHEPYEDIILKRGRNF